MLLSWDLLISAASIFAEWQLWFIDYKICIMGGASLSYYILYFNIHWLLHFNIGLIIVCYLGYAYPKKRLKGNIIPSQPGHSFNPQEIDDRGVNVFSLIRQYFCLSFLKMKYTFQRQRIEVFRLKKKTRYIFINSNKKICNVCIYRKF